LERVPDSPDKQWTPVWESYENGNEIPYSTQHEYHSLQNIKFQDGSLLLSCACLINENRRIRSELMDKPSIYGHEGLAN